MLAALLTNLPFGGIEIVIPKRDDDEELMLLISAILAVITESP